MEISDLPADPFELFDRWLRDAGGADALPNAMALATTTLEGRPSNRFVLLKGADTRGFVFFSNYASRKGQELTENPRAAAAIFWTDPRRQVRVEGTVERLAAEESDSYFATRDRPSQIGATVSPQSRIIEGRRGLDEAVERMTSAAEGRPIPRPEHWGGYRIIPDAIEFWEGRENRLHDRFQYRRSREGWEKHQLAP